MLRCHNSTVYRQSFDMSCCTDKVQIAYRLVECTVEFPFQFGRWQSFDLCLSIKPNLPDEKCSFVFVNCFSSDAQLKNNGHLAPQRIFAVVRMLSLYNALSCTLSQLGEGSSSRHVFTPFFQNASFYLFDFILEGHCKIKQQNGACAHYVMVSKFQWKPFWLATQRDPQNDWTATQNRVNYDVFAQAPFNNNLRRGFVFRYTYFL